MCTKSTYSEIDSRSLSGCPHPGIVVERKTTELYCPVYKQYMLGPLSIISGQKPDRTGTAPLVPPSTQVLENFLKHRYFN
jgi:hypothetical protein